MSLAQERMTATTASNVRLRVGHLCEISPRLWWNGNIFLGSIFWAAWGTTPVKNFVKRTIATPRCRPVDKRQATIQINTHTPSQ